MKEFNALRMGTSGLALNPLAVGILATMMWSAALCAQSPAAWSVGGSPVVALGVTRADTLRDVTDVRFGKDASLIVASRHEVRVYAASGALAGRSSWPTGANANAASPEVTVVADSFGVRDVLQFREQWFDHTGRPGSAVNSGSQFGASQRMRVMNGTMVRVPSADQFDCARAVLSATGMPAGNVLREAVLDDRGRLWVAEVGGREWTVRDAAGAAIGTVAFIRPLTIFAIQGTLIAAEYHGVHRDTIVVLRVASEASKSAPLPCHAHADDRSAIAKPRMLLMRSMSAAEDLRSSLGHYVSTSDSLMPSAPAGLHLMVLHAGTTGWLGGVVDATSGAACLVGIGDAAPPGWGDGVIHCGA